MNLHCTLTDPMSDHVTLKRASPLRQRHLALLLVASLSSPSMAAAIEFRSNPSGFEMAVADGLEWHFLESSSGGETNFNQAGAEQRCAKAGDSTSPGLRLPTEVELRALASAGTHRYNYVFWSSTPGVGRTTMTGFFDKRYTFPDPLNMKLRLMCVRRAQTAVASSESRLGTAQVTASAPVPKPITTAAVQPGPASMLEQQRLIDQLDQMDKMDLQTELDRAQACTTRRDFPCSEKSLAKAARYAKGTRDKAAVAQAQTSLQAEVELVREEESQRVARLERQRRDEERARRDQRDAEAAAERMAERRENEAARSAALASVVGALARPQQSQDWLQAETRATLARASQQIAQANRDQAAAAAARQAAADQAARERLAARQQAQAAAEQRASADAAQAWAQRQAEQTRLAEQDRRDEQARRERELERDRERQQRLAAQTAATRGAPGAPGTTISQIAPPGPPVIPYPTRCPPGYVPSDGTVMPMSAPREGICIRQSPTTSATTSGANGGVGAGVGAGGRTDSGTAAANSGAQTNTGSGRPPGPMVVAGGGSQPRTVGNSPGGGSNLVPPTAPPPIAVSPPLSEPKPLIDMCMSHSTQIPLRMSVCYAKSMRQYVCRKYRNDVGLGFVQKLILKSSLTDANLCTHVDYTNDLPARENLEE